MPTTPELTIFFDGACPLCRREIAHYLRRDRSGRLAALDIAADPAPLAILGVTQRAALAALLARDAAGQVHIGAAAFLAIWERLPRWRLAARAIRALPGGLSLMEIAYRAIAPRRARIAAALCPGDTCRR
ncbi:MAG: thiol-disulfide oxidoreductase DCC family protein [Rhodospirillales bacterium]